mgnify:CR=1 FL=1
MLVKSDEDILNNENVNENDDLCQNNEKKTDEILNETQQGNNLRQISCKLSQR